MKPKFEIIDPLHGKAEGAPMRVTEATNDEGDVVDLHAVKHDADAEQEYQMYLKKAYLALEE